MEATFQQGQDCRGPRRCCRWKGWGGGLGSDAGRRGRGSRQCCRPKGWLTGSPGLGIDFVVSQCLCDCLEATGYSCQAADKQHINKLCSCLPGGIM